MNSYVAVIVSICNFEHFIVANVHEKFFDAPDDKRAKSKSKQMVGGRNSGAVRDKRCGKWKTHYTLHCILKIKRAKEDRFNTLFKIVKVIPA